MEIKGNYKGQDLQFRFQFGCTSLIHPEVDFCSITEFHSVAARDSALTTTTQLTQSIFDVWSKELHKDLDKFIEDAKTLVMDGISWPQPIIEETNKEQE